MRGKKMALFIRIVLGLIYVFGVMELIEMLNDGGVWKRKK
jgi:hypothetical protein